MTTNKRYNMYKLLDDIGEWSRHNFQDQPASFPLHGVAEELMEFYTAEKEDVEIDSIADAGIYLMDFCSRANVNLVQGAVDNMSRVFAQGKPTPTKFIIAYGKMCRAYLKLQQKIRKNEGHAEVLQDQCGTLWCMMDALLYNNYRSDLSSVVGDTFYEVVQKRDWTKERSDDAS